MFQSISKIIQSYFTAVSKNDFEYKNKVYKAKPLRVSPSLFKGTICPEGCGGCCPKFSLDYLPNEPHPYPLEERKIEFNGENFIIYSDMQHTNPTTRCKHLNQVSGRCGIHGKHPFTCDFELIRTLIYEKETQPNVIGARLYGRGWNMLRVDGERGALCTMTLISPETIKSGLRKLKRLEEWCQYFKVDSWLPAIIKRAEAGHFSRSIIYGQELKGILSTKEKK